MYYFVINDIIVSGRWCCVSMVYSQGVGPKGTAFVRIHVIKKKKNWYHCTYIIICYLLLLVSTYLCIPSLSLFMLG